MILQNKPVHRGIPLLRDVYLKASIPSWIWLWHRRVLVYLSLRRRRFRPTGWRSCAPLLQRCATTPSIKPRRTASLFRSASRSPGDEVATMMNELKASATPEVVAGYKRLGAGAQ